MKFHIVQAAVLAACSVLAAPASAQSDGAAAPSAGAFAWNPSASFAGFGTLGYVAIDTDQAQYNAPGQYGGVGKEGGLGPDSKLGLQVNAKANGVFSGTVQVLTARNGEGHYKPGVEWAFVKAQATSDLAFRAGRIGGPFFAVSDFRNVGYSNLWVRPPLDVYAQVPISHFDGADALYTKTLGPATVTAQVFGGSASSVNDEVKVDVKSLMGVNVTAEFDNGITVRAGTASGKLTVHSDAIEGLASVLRASGFTALGDQVDLTSRTATFSGVGLTYDHDEWVGSAEYTWRTGASEVADTTGWAITGGYRVGKFTPFLGYSRLRVDHFNIDDTLPPVPQLAPLKAGVDAVIAFSDIAEKTATAGLRWDAFKSVALKAQLDRVTPHQGGNFYLPQPGLAGRTVNVYSLSADFVF